MQYFKSIFLVLSVVIFLYSIPYLHEIGHYLAACLMGFENITVKFTKYGFPHEVNIGLDESKLVGINSFNLRVLFCLICGPIFGLIPFALLFLLPSPDNSKYILSILAIWYLIRCCSADFRTIFHILNIN